MVMGFLEIKHEALVKDVLESIQAESNAGLAKYPFIWEKALEPVLEKPHMVKTWIITLSSEGTHILLQQEINGVWSWPGGKVEPEDTVLGNHSRTSRAAASRETMEETKQEFNPDH